MTDTFSQSGQPSNASTGKPSGVGQAGFQSIQAYFKPGGAAGSGRRILKHQMKTRAGGPFHEVAGKHDFHILLKVIFAEIE